MVVDIISAIAAIATPVTLVIAILTFARGIKKDAVTDAKTDTQQLSVLTSDLGYVKASTDEIKSEIKQQRQDITQIKIDLSAVQASAKQAHKRIDRIEGLDGHGE